MTNRKKLLLATNHSYMFYRFRKELVKALQNDFEVYLSTPFVGHENDFKEMGIEVIDIDLSRRSINPVEDFRLVRQYQWLIRQIKPDLVVTYSIKPNVYLSKICAVSKIPYFCHVQGLGTAFETPVVRMAASFLYKQGLKAARGVFFENEANLNFFKEYGILPENRGILLPGAGVSLEEYQYSKIPENSEFHFLYLGRFMKEKGMDELLEALGKLRESGARFHFDFAGFCEDEYQDKLDTIVQEGWATNHGFVEDPRELYRKTSCVVLPSWHEGMSNVLLEAAAMGRPVITTRIPGCMESVEDGVTGILVEKKNSIDLLKAMERMVALTTEKLNKMGKAGRKKMEDEFSREAVVQETVRVLKGKFID